ncbi:class I SAM-dependent DNA methyltransferase [Candidatus Brocadia pituitae]|nr:class I SAM-dependent DNA methyltransferase [Candidatus Brocadia pituitae]
MQRNFVAWYLNGSRGGEMKDAALVAFVSPDAMDWRFSLVKMDYKFEQTQTGKTKVKEEFTPARRWSFLVGANENSHTAQSRLVYILANDEHSPTLAELEQAFDIETVTREFFIKYRELFIRTKEELDKLVAQASSLQNEFKSKGIDTVNFAKKLLGQIVFLYFLQKKGWFGVGRDAEWGTGSKHFLRELFGKKHGNYNNFFNDILEPLFYEALRIDRSHADDYYSRFNCKIPFLNGGLFDPIGSNGGYNWVHTDICLPDSLFSNKNKTKEGDEGDGILDIFDRYNFTVREDEPLEKEVAIDPELLGKAYEKFNAIRPDNFEEYKKALKSGKKGEESKFNKQYGVYYTPREIVHYMCQQSLINYLHTELITPNPDRVPNPVRVKDIETLIHLGEQVSENEEIALIKEQKILEGEQKSSYYKLKLPEGIRKNASLIDQKLADITVCDPAVGSGAFPVGMMGEIVKARNVLTPFLSLRGANATKQSQTGDCFAGARNDHMPGETQASLSAYGDAQAGRKTLTGFQTLSGLKSGTPRTIYDFKRHCIEKSLYGVDIDPGAVEIAKLRLWLSLVVDEDDIKNIKPLPNLDYKIVCGNSLLGVEKNLFNNHLFSKLEKIKPLYFNETNPTKKQDYKKQIDELISQITNGHKEFDFKIYFSEVFHHKGGFDVVIANPPYVGFHGINKQFKQKLQQTYVSADGKFDLYLPFIERSYALMSSKGFSVFICPTAFTKRDHGERLRQFLRKNVCIKELVDFEHDQVFEGATNYTGIFSFIKNRPDNCSFIYRTSFNESGMLIEQSKLTDASWIFSASTDAALVVKVESGGKKLHEVSKISEGVVTGLNNLYLLSREIITTNSFELKYFVRCVRGKEIDKYYIQDSKELLFYPYIKSANSKTVPIDEEKLIKNASKYHKHLKNNIEKIKSRPYFVKSKKKWYELWNQRDLDNFSMVKILTPELSERNRFAIAGENVFYGDTVCGIIINYKYLQSIDYKFLLAVLNSRLIEWYYKKTTVPKAGGFFIYKVMFLKNVPIKIPSFASQQKIIPLVDQILAAKQKDPDADTSSLERRIDHLVYQLYGLTADEIGIVEERG